MEINRLRGSSRGPYSPFSCRDLALALPYPPPPQYIWPSSELTADSIQDTEHRTVTYHQFMAGWRNTGGSHLWKEQRKDRLASPVAFWELQHPTLTSMEDTQAPSDH